MNIFPNHYRSYGSEKLASGSRRLCLLLPEKSFRLHLPRKWTKCVDLAVRGRGKGMGMITNFQYQRTKILHHNHITNHKPIPILVLVKQTKTPPFGRGSARLFYFFHLLVWDKTFEMIIQDQLNHHQNVACINEMIYSSSSYLDGGSFTFWISFQIPCGTIDLMSW